MLFKSSYFFYFTCLTSSFDLAFFEFFMLLCNSLGIAYIKPTVFPIFAAYFLLVVTKVIFLQ